MEFNKVQTWAIGHPKAVKGLCAAMVIFAAYNLCIAIDLSYKIRDVMGELQKAASEAMGG